MKNWKEVTVDDIAENVTVGFVGSMASEYTDYGILFLRSQNIEPFKLNLKSNQIKYISDKFHNKISKSSLISGDVAMVRTGYPGTCCVIPNNIGKINCSDLVIIRPNHSIIDSHFLCYFFNSPLGKASVKGNLVGAAQQHFNVGVAKKIKINLPPYLVQKKIAGVLSAYDDLIENNTQRIKLLEEMSEEIYKEWFVRFRFPGYKDAKFFDKDGSEVACGTVGALPEGWKKSMLKNHIEYFRGKSYSSEELRENDGLAMLNLKNIKRGGGFRRDGLKYFEGKYNKHNEAQSGDIIMAVTDMTQEREIVGRVARVPDLNQDKFIISMDLIRIEPLALPKLYLYAFFRYSGIGFQLKEFANGANVLHLTPDLICFQKVMIPTSTVCMEFEKLIKPIIEEIDILGNKNDILQETRDLLLPRLISGKLSVEELDIDEENLNIAAEPVVNYNI